MQPLNDLPRFTVCKRQTVFKPRSLPFTFTILSRYPLMHADMKELKNNEQLLGIIFNTPLMFLLLRDLSLVHHFSFNPTNALFKHSSCLGNHTGS